MGDHFHLKKRNTKKQIETIIKDDNGNEIGRLHVNKWGANFNLNNGKIDVQAVSEGLLGLLISTEETI